MVPFQGTQKNRTAVLIQLPSPVATLVGIVATPLIIGAVMLFGWEPTPPTPRLWRL